MPLCACRDAPIDMGPYLLPSASLLGPLQLWVLAERFDFKVYYLKKKSLELGMVPHTSPSIQEVEAEKSLQVQGQHRLHSDPFSVKQKENQKL